MSAEKVKESEPRPSEHRARDHDDFGAWFEFTFPESSKFFRGLHRVFVIVRCLCRERFAPFRRGRGLYYG